MKISSLEPQKKDKNRLNLYIDGQFQCGVDIGTAARLGFYDGKEIGAKDLDRLDTEEEYQKCMNSALNLASRRRQSEREYWQKLGKNFEKPVIGKVLDRLRVLGYADDQRFAEMWVRERSRSRGKRLLSQELDIKGIDKNIVTQLLSGLPEEDELETATSLAIKKYKKEQTREENYSRIISFLTRKGYSYSTSKQVFNQLTIGE